MLRRRIRKYHEVLHSHSYVHETVEYPLIITLALYSRWGPGDAFSFRTKESMSLNIITQGNAAYQQDGRDGVVESGQVFLAHRGSSQRFATGSAGFLNKRSLRLEGWLLDLLVEKTGLRKVDCVAPAQPERLIGQARTAFRLLRDKPPDFVPRLSAVAYEVLIELARGTTADKPAEVLHAMDFVRRQLAAPLRLADIARASGTSVRTCNRLFARNLGMSPIEFLITQRMAMAREMLVNTSLPVKQVAAATGYDDPFHFSRQVRKRFGMSPRDLRDRRR